VSPFYWTNGITTDRPLLFIVEIPLPTSTPVESVAHEEEAEEAVDAEHDELQDEEEDDDDTYGIDAAVRQTERETQLAESVQPLGEEPGESLVLVQCRREY
jgi:hypothetical protein